MPRFPGTLLEDQQPPSLAPPVAAAQPQASTVKPRFSGTPVDGSGPALKPRFAGTLVVEDPAQLDSQIPEIIPPQPEDATLTPQEPIALQDAGPIPVDAPQTAAIGLAGPEVLAGVAPETGEPSVTTEIGKSIKAFPMQMAQTGAAVAEFAAKGVEEYGKLFGADDVMAKAGRAWGDRAQADRKYWEEKLQSPELAMHEDLQGRVFDSPELMKDPAWVARTTTDAVTSMIPVVIGYMTGGKLLGGAAGGTLEAQQTWGELIDEGVAPWKAATGAILTGVGTGTLNAIGIDKILGPSAGTFINRAVKGYLINGSWEAGTEWLEEPMNAVIKGVAKLDSDATMADVAVIANDAKEAAIDGLNVILPSFLTAGLFTTANMVGQKKGKGAVKKDDTPAPTKEEAFAGILSAKSQDDAVKILASVTKEDRSWIKDQFTSEEGAKETDKLNVKPESIRQVIERNTGISAEKEAGELTEDEKAEIAQTLEPAVRDQTQEDREETFAPGTIEAQQEEIAAREEQEAGDTEAAQFEEQVKAELQTKQAEERQSAARAGRFAVAGDVVDGRKVRAATPNISSIKSTFNNPEEMEGIREVPMSAFALDESGTPTGAGSKKLAEEIKDSGEINPLIVAIDEQGPYILEGSHRYDALKVLGATSFPAVVVKEAAKAGAKPRFPGTPVKEKADAEKITDVKEVAEEKADVKTKAEEEAGAEKVLERREVDATGTRTERREDEETRGALEKKVSEMSLEEAQEALRKARKEAATDELTGLKSKKAFNQREEIELLESLDVDNLKWWNDKVSNAVGDQVLITMGDALASTDLGKVNKATHYSGDEFYLEAKTQEELDSAIQQAYNYLRENPLTVTTKTNDVYEIVVDFSHGTATITDKSPDPNSKATSSNDHQKEAADARLKDHKELRIKEGTKAAERDALPANAKLISRGVDKEGGDRREDVLSGKPVTAKSLVESRTRGEINKQLDLIFGTHEELDASEMAGEETPILDAADKFRADIEYAANERNEKEVEQLLVALRKDIPEDRRDSFSVSRKAAEDRDIQPEPEVSKPEVAAEQRPAVSEKPAKKTKGPVGKKIAERKPSKKKEPKLAKAKPTGKSTVAELTKAVDKLVTANGRESLRIEVVQTVVELAEGLQLFSSEVDGTVIGAYNPRTGKITLVADNMSTDQAWAFVLHEGIHKLKFEKGWAGVFGKKSDGIMKSIDVKLKLNNPAWKAAERKAENAGTKPDSMREETIAWFMADSSNQNQGLWRRIANAIRAWAVSVGIKRNITDADVVSIAEYSLQREARKKVAPKQKEKQEPSEPLFAKETPDDIDEIIVTMKKKGLLAKDAEYPDTPSAFKTDRELQLIDKVSPEMRDLYEQGVMFWADRDDPKRLIQNRYGEQPERTDYLMAERLRGKKTAAEVKRFSETEVNPILEHLAKNDLEIADLEEYAMVKHVPERNEQMRRINAKLYLNTIATIKGGKAGEDLRYEIDNASANIEREGRRDAYLNLLDTELAAISKDDKNYDKLAEQKKNWKDRSVNFAGMTDGEASQILNRWKSDTRVKAVEKARTMLAKVNEGRLTALVESGELTSEQASIIDSTYKFYVPFHREGFVDGKPASGRSTGPLGKAIKGATGSQKKVIDILANSVANRQAAISRKQKALTGQKLFNLVSENPDPENWWIEENKKATSHDADGNVIFYPEQQEPPNGVHVKIEGKRYTVMVNQNDATMMRMMQSIKDVDVGMGPILSGIAKVTRTLASLNTTLSPEFIVTNLIRDLQTAGINIDDTEATGGQAAIAKNIPSAISGIYRAERGTESEWGKLYRDFEDNGGKIGWMQSYDNVADLAKSLSNEMKLYQEGHVTKKTIRALSDLLEASNVAIENGVRLATYDYLINIKKLNKRRAAIIVSNLTVDFTRRGSGGQGLNALYMFANAGIQGNIRMIKAAVRSPKVRKMLGGIVATGFAMHFLALATGGDDDDGIAHYDKVDDSLKERNMIFMLKDGKMVKVPMPYGYNIFFNLGDELAKMVSANRSGKAYSKTKGAARLTTSLLNTFNPMASATLLQAVMPTIGDPIAHVAENKTWFGGDLMPQKSPYGIPKPRSQRFWRSVSPASKYVAAEVNRLSGGDTVKPGIVDVSPETLDLIFDTYTGSAGRFVKDTLQLPIRAAQGTLEARKVPFVRRFYGEPFEGKSGQLYRDRLTEVLTLAEQIKVAEPEQRRELRKDAMSRLIISAKQTDRQIKKLSKSKKVREARGLDIERDKENIKRLQTRFIKRFEDIKNK